jgi:hypothetical protein
MNDCADALNTSEIGRPSLSEHELEKKPDTLTILFRFCSTWPNSIVTLICSINLVSPAGEVL